MQYIKKNPKGFTLFFSFLIAIAIVIAANFLAVGATPAFALTALQNEDGDSCYEDIWYTHNSYCDDPDGTDDSYYSYEPDPNDPDGTFGYCHNWYCEELEDDPGDGGSCTPQCTDMCGGDNSCGGTCGDGLNPECNPPPDTCSDGVTPKTDINGDGIVDEESCPCEPPTTDTQTLSCAEGETGQIDQERTKNDPPACWSSEESVAWGTWQTVSNTCMPIEEEQCEEPLSETSTESCPANQEGQIDYQRNKGEYPGCGWGDWYVTENTCACPAGTEWNGLECVSSETAGTISVFTNNAASSWTINPGNHAGSGTSGSYQLLPSSGGTTYSISASNIPNFTTLVTNSDGGGTTLNLLPGNSKSFTITYSSGSGFDYALSNGGNKSVDKSSTNVFATNTVTRTAISGVQAPVSLLISGLPSGVSVSTSNNPCTSTCSSTLTFTVQPSAPTGTHQITVAGSATGAPVHTTQFNLTINPSPILSIACNPSPSPAVVGQPVTWTAVVAGGTPGYTYTWAGTNFPTNPAPSSNPFPFTYQTTGSKTAQVTVRDNDGTGATAQCPTSQLQVNVKPVFQEF